jgi:transglutaminase/protease-like cytokinesis protein 3
MKSKLYALLLPVLMSIAAAAQTGGRDFKAVDDYVKSLGPLEGMSMGTINNVVSKKFPEKIDRARAIFDWIASNISYDVKAGRMNNNAKNTPTEVLKSRQATSIGFASLFQDMCSAGDVRCLTVDGFVKNNTQQIGEKETDINHTWAVVQLGESPDTWFYVDPSWGSGYPDAEMKTFTKYFNPGYFFAEKQIFNWQYFPDNDAWKLGPAPKNKGDFYDLPLIKGMSHELGLKSFSPHSGKVKAKPTKAVSFSYKIKNDAPISKVTLLIGEKKKIRTKDVNFNYSGGLLSFEYKFEEESSYPVTVLVDGKELITYLVDVE